MKSKQLDKFTRAYAEAALWSTSDGSDERGGEPLDANYTVDDFAPETLERFFTDCRRFQEQNSADIAAGDNRPEYGVTATERAGHSFWLTRNRHGAGFWDGDWPDKPGERLTVAAEAFGEVWLDVGDAGLIYIA